MTRRWAPAGPGVWRAEGEPLPPVPDTVVWDVDGVLVDTSRSYPRVVAQAVALLLDMAGAPGRGSTVGTADIRHFKALSGFNSDWALVEALTIASLVLLPRLGGRREAVRRALTGAAFLAEAAAAGGGTEGLLAPLGRMAASGVRAARARVRQLPVAQVCESLYGGPETEELFGRPSILRHPGEGLWRKERARITAADLEALPGVRHGVYTGRLRGELQPALRVTAFDQIVTAKALVTPEDGVLKPDPEGLRRLATVLGTHAGLFVGDNVDDVMTVSALNASGDGRFRAVGVLGGTLGASARRTFASAGAHLIAAEPRRLVQWLALRRGSH
jgi:phosphoglycolate phosphatase-like HAD superfamily hydrolase